MNTSSLWRLEFATQVAQSYQSNPHIEAIILGGSTARGHSDHFSDIELGMFWNQPPTEAERTSAVEKMEADLIRVYPYFPDEEVWCDDFMLGRSLPDQPKTGVLVEVAHHTTDMVDRVLNEVIQHYNPDENKQNLISGLLDGIPLKGAKQVYRWKKSARQYPEGLQMAVVKKHAQIDHFWRWQMFIERGQNLMLLYQLFSQVEMKIIHMLLGLNRVYYFGFKWMDKVVERFDLSPPQLLYRMNQIYVEPPQKAALILAELVDETYDLIQTHLSGLDISWYRDVFHYQRPFWKSRPPYPASGQLDK